MSEEQAGARASFIDGQIHGLAAAIATVALLSNAGSHAEAGRD